MSELPAYELTRNPVDETWGFICREHGIHRTGLAQRHATNVEAKHVREQHAEPEEPFLNVTAMAELVLEWTDKADPGRTPLRTQLVLVSAWEALTGLEGEAALVYARQAASVPTTASVAPF